MLKVIIPIGISFYTFEAINYTVDVFRKQVKAERNLAHFMLFILFFPHLVAGPIVRARDFLHQINRTKRWNWVRASVGCQYILLGGSRGGLALTCRNLMITMALGGLWHGASWNFVIWGVLHGLLLVLHRLFHLIAEKWQVLGKVLQAPAAAPFCVVLTFLF